MKQARNQRETGSKQSWWFLTWLIFFILKMKAKYLSQTPVDFQRTTQRYIAVEIFINAAVRTSNPAWPVYNFSSFNCIEFGCVIYTIQLWSGTCQSLASCGVRI
jgi:hypothetical protein